ncbi:hypothetical protein ACMFMG_005528 [Clarireedia jacksonii]
MSQSLKNVIIIGAGGHLGPWIVSAFDNDPNFNVSILSRTSSKSKFPQHLKVHLVNDDYPETKLLSAFNGQDAIISAMAPDQVSLQHKLINAAIKAGVKRFVPSEFGSDTRNTKAVELLPEYFNAKLETIDYLRSKEKEGLTWSAFVTGIFFELGVKDFMGFDLDQHKATIYGHGNDTYSATTFASIGTAVKNALLLPEKTASKYIFINTFNVSQNQVLASLEKATGVKWNVNYLDAEEQKQIGLKRLSEGDFEGAMILIRYINSIHGNGGNYAEYEETANDLLSVPKQNLDEVIASIAKE